MKPPIKGVTEKELVEMMLTDKPSKMIWNVAIEECCLYLESKSNEYNTAISMLRKLKK